MDRIDQTTAGLQDAIDEARKAAQEAAVAAGKASAFATTAEIAAQHAVEARPGKAWYAEPAWYALCTPIVLAAIALYAYRERKRTSVANAQRNVLLRAVEINEAFVRHQILGPVALSLGRSTNDEALQFTKKTVLLLHQMILLRQVYEQRDLLGEAAEQSHQRWASSVLKPWIESDPDLVEVWRQLSQGRDLLGPDFLEWLEPHIGPPTPANPPPPTNAGGTLG